MNKSDFSQSILITGGNRGMGLEYVKHYLNKGKFVVATARTNDSSSELDHLREAYADHLLVLRLDVANAASIVKFTKELELMKPKFSIVINNAGISLGEEFGKWTMATFETHFRVNTIGPALISQAITPYMQDGAKLVQISSGMGSLSWNIDPQNQFDAYAASKCALHSITLRLAEKLKPKKIGVFALNPGWVQTKMGGEDAPTKVDKAVADIVKTIENLTIEQTGTFLSEIGKPIPW